MKYLGSDANNLDAHLSELGHDVLELRDLPEAAHLLVHHRLQARHERAVARPLRRHRPPHRNALRRKGVKLLILISKSLKEALILDVRNLPQRQISTANLCVAQSPEVAVQLLGAGVDEALHARVGHAAERVAHAAAIGGRRGDGG